MGSGLRGAACTVRNNFAMTCADDVAKREDGALATIERFPYEGLTSRKQRKARGRCSKRAKVINSERAHDVALVRDRAKHHRQPIYGEGAILNKRWNQSNPAVIIYDSQKMGSRIGVRVACRKRVRCGAIEHVGPYKCVNSIADLAKPQPF